MTELSLSQNFMVKSRISLVLCKYKFLRCPLNSFPSFQKSYSSSELSFLLNLHFGLFISVVSENFFFNLD